MREASCGAHKWIEHVGEQKDKRQDVQNVGPKHERTCVQTAGVPDEGSQDCGSSTECSRGHPKKKREQAIRRHHPYPCQCQHQ